MKTTEEIKEQLANKFLNGLRNRDWDLMRSALTDDVTWTLPGTSLLSGPAIGADAVIKRANQLRDFGVMVKLNHILYGLDSVALSLHNTASRGDLILDEYVAIVCDISDGKIVRIVTHLSDVEGINRFFVEGVI
ncbi:nuclear transport factor 2 family protein [Mucilaginibacter celer]|uniref:Nuclear transport factor 2 family protein n=1 Tax=Mucilaginibacter celer TaxID=2305508 RepID=A0A494VSH7_9SPHI|nr:nuclear transport factor 2 family protein [Mucilaginibacter celer]AYL93892.1 nuclear transport factor 2 family protein [Mucilaginibacter celer]